MQSGPPPRSCFESETEVQVPDRVDDLFVTTSRAAREPLEEGEHSIGCVVELNHCIAALEVPLLRLRRPFAILDGPAPLAAPCTEAIESVGDLSSFCVLLIYCVLPEASCQRPYQAGRCLIYGSQRA